MDTNRFTTTYTEEDIPDEKYHEALAERRKKMLEKCAAMGAVIDSYCSKRPRRNVVTPRPRVQRIGLIKNYPCVKLEHRGEGNRKFQTWLREIDAGVGSAKRKFQTWRGDLDTGVGSEPQASGLSPSVSLDSETKRRSIRLDIDGGEKLDAQGD